MTRWLDSDDSNDNIDISSATEVGSYTADDDRLVAMQLFADQVAGNGDYTAYITHQVGGSGSEYRYIPITTAEAANGVTAIAFQAILIFVRSGDVLKVYIDGLAGDTATPDTLVRWAEIAALRPATADREIVVDASGNVALADGYLTAAKFADAFLTAAKIGTDALTAAKIAADAIGASELAADAVAEIVADIFSELVPGDYAQGSAGWRLGKIGTATVSVTSPVAENGDVLVYQGDDYNNADGRALDWEDDGGTWPDLTDATIAVIIDGVASLTGSVVTPTGTGKVRLELTATQTLALKPVGKTFQVVATLSSSRKATLVEATWVTRKRAAS